MLLGRPEQRQGQIAIVYKNIEHLLRVDPIETKVLIDLLSRMDGQLTLDELSKCSAAVAPDEVRDIVEALDRAGLVDDLSEISTRNGMDVILELEDLTDELCSNTLFRSPFWQQCLEACKPGDIPMNVVIGLVIENYHFLFRESYFDAPVLSYVPNSKVRLLMNQFFAEEYGHDEILLRALTSVGIDREDLADAIPLPETMGLCNALAYWSHNDPLFFFTTLGLLEGQSLKTDSFIDACDRIGIDPAFICPLRQHANINSGRGHGNLTRNLFQQITALDDTTIARLRAQTHLFIELYTNFYDGIWSHYSSTSKLLRRVSEL
jgi:hypothetical protein